MLHRTASPSSGLRSPCQYLVLLLAAAWTVPVQAKPPLHERIDQEIAAGTPEFTARASPLASDAEFLRRLHLDVTGTIPTASEARAFLNDPSPDKRRVLVDRLLASPEHSRHLHYVFDVMLMERRRDKHVPRAQWQEYLRSSFAANKPWDQLVREILSSDGVDAKLRPAAKFTLDREGELHNLTRDIGRLFLGVDLQCAQCHDHPLVEDYKQEHYYGIFAFLNRSYVFTDPKSKPGVLAEKSDGEVTFQSVFDPKKATKNTGPRLPGGPAIAEPKLEKGKEYEIAPANGVRPVPRFSRRAQLPGQLTSDVTSAFRRNIANRLWALLMGRGLVHPLDLDHSANPPSHPELLDLLGNEFAAMKFDIREFLRELVLSQTYQRSSQLQSKDKEVEPESFAVAQLKPLSPEQLAWGVMQATGLIDAQRTALGKNLTEQTLHAKLADNVGPFVAAFGAPPGQPEGQTFQATLDQALFLANGGLVRGWLQPRPGNLTDRLAHLAEPGAAAEELFLSILTRYPSGEEKHEVAAYLQARPQERAAALQELAWALLASAEFRFNH